MVQRLLLIVAVVALIAGCVHTNATLLDPTAAAYAPVDPSQVRIFTDASELDTLEFVRIADIEASGTSGYTSRAGMLEAIRKKAGKLGGNGVLMPQIQEPSAGAKVAAAIFGTGAERTGNALAIRVIGPKKQPTPPPETPSATQPQDTTKID